MILAASRYCIARTFILFQRRQSGTCCQAQSQYSGSIMLVLSQKDKTPILSCWCFDVQCSLPVPLQGGHGYSMYVPGILTQFKGGGGQIAILNGSFFVDYGPDL